MAPWSSLRFSCVVTGSQRFSKGSPRSCEVRRESPRFAEFRKLSLTSAKVPLSSLVLGFDEVRHSSLRYAQVRTGAVRFAEVRESSQKFVTVREVREDSLRLHQVSSRVCTFLHDSVRISRFCMDLKGPLNIEKDFSEEAFRVSELVFACTSFCGVPYVSMRIPTLSRKKVATKCHTQSTWTMEFLEFDTLS